MVPLEARKEAKNVFVLRFSPDGNELQKKPVSYSPRQYKLGSAISWNKLQKKDNNRFGSINFGEFLKISKQSNWIMAFKNIIQFIFTITFSLNGTFGRPEGLSRDNGTKSSKSGKTRMTGTVENPSLTYIRITKYSNTLGFCYSVFCWFLHKLVVIFLNTNVSLFQH